MDNQLTDDFCASSRANKVKLYKKNLENAKKMFGELLHVHLRF